MTALHSAEALERRLRRLEDRIEIGELIARYGLVMDDRDIGGMPALFTPDVEVHSLDGTMNASGRDAAIELFRRQLAGIGPSNHVTHDRIITFDDARADHATGVVLSHAELSRRGVAMVAAIRYNDVYQRDAQAWRFRVRNIGFMYFVDAADYPDALGPGLALRNRILDRPRVADWPESLPTWRHFFGV